MIFLNPSESATREYVAGASPRNWNSPCALVLAIASAPVAVLVSVNLTEGTTAPEESFTVPDTVPTGDANKGSVPKNESRTALTAFFIQLTLDARNLKKLHEV